MDERLKAQKRSRLTRIATAGIALIGAVTLIFVVAMLRKGAPAMTTPYQAVLLSSGSAYFGKLTDLGTPYPVLTEVFYVQSVQNPATKQVSNILVKRGKEWHSPDHMILNANMIVPVEPVSPGSRVAQLIAVAKN